MSKGRKIRILYIEEVSGFGGSTACLTNLIKRMPCEKYEKYLVSYYRNDEVFNVAEIGLSGIYFLDKNENRSGNWLISRILFISEGIRRIRRTVAIIKEIKADVVHTNNSIGINFYTIVAAKLSGVLCVAHLRNIESEHTIQRLGQKMVQRIIAVSQCVLESIGAKGRQRASMIYDGLTPDEVRRGSDAKDCREDLGFGKEDFIVAFVGMLNPWKGVDVFIKSVAIFCRQNPHAKAVILGDEVDGTGEYKRYLYSLVSGLGLHEKVVFAGVRYDIKDIYPMLDIVVHASVTPEPFGRVIIEAMAAGRPVIASNLGGPVELIENGVNGVLYEAGNPERLAEAVLTLMNDTSARVAMGRAAQEFVETNFVIENTVHQTIEIYEEVCP